MFLKGVTPTIVTSANLSHKSGQTSVEHPTTAGETTGHDTFNYVLSQTHADDFDVDAFIADFEEENGDASCHNEDLDAIDLDAVTDDDALNIDDVTDLLTDFDDEHRQDHQQDRPAHKPVSLNLIHTMARFTPVLPPQPQMPNAPPALFSQLLQPSNRPQPTPPVPTVAVPAILATMPSKKLHKSKARLDSKQWTDRETECLRQGIALFGTQKYKWTLIKKHFGDELRARSNVDLKDRWRNLLGRKQRRNRKPRKGPYSR